MRLFSWWSNNNDTKVNPSAVEASSPCSSKILASDPSSASPQLKAENTRPFSENEPKSSPKWKKGKLLGQGSHSTCYAVSELKTGKKCAAKFVSKSHAAEHTLKEEFDLLTKLCHRNVIKTLDFVETHESFILVMERGHITLLELLMSHGRFSAKEVQMYGHQMAEGLSYLHHESVVHRDFKLENLLVVGTEKKLKIADFGLAFDCKRNPFQLECSGTIPYMAPEVITASSTFVSYGKPIDIWSFGVVLYMLTVGMLPFKYHHGNERKSLQSILHDEIPYPKEVSHVLHHLLRGMFRKDPKHRLTIEEVLAHPYFKASF